MVKKHREVILPFSHQIDCCSLVEQLSFVLDIKLKSTTEILHQTEARVKKKINWADLFRTLRDLEDKGLIIKHETKGGFFWQKKNI